MKITSNVKITYTLIFFKRLSAVKPMDFTNCVTYKKFLISDWVLARNASSDKERSEQANQMNKNTEDYSVASTSLLAYALAV